MDFGKNSCVSVAHSMKIQFLPTSSSEHGSCWLHLMLLSPLLLAGSARTTAPTISSYNRYTLRDWHHILSLDICQRGTILQRHFCHRSQSASLTILVGLLSNFQFSHILIDITRSELQTVLKMQMNKVLTVGKEC